MVFIHAIHRHMGCAFHGLLHASSRHFPGSWLSGDYLWESLKTEKREREREENKQSWMHLKVGIHMQTKRKQNKSGQATKQKIMVNEQSSGVVSSVHSHLCSRWHLTYRVCPALPELFPSLCKAIRMEYLLLKKFPLGRLKGWAYYTQRCTLVYN